MDLLLAAALIGIVQGLTEFLPVSSSAHLTLLPALLGMEGSFVDGAAFVVMLHVGTLVALLAVFWRDVLRILAAGVDLARERRMADDPDRRLFVLLAVSVVPAALVGALFEPFFDTWFREHLLGIPAILVAGAVLLWAAERIGRRDRGMDALRVPEAFGLGVAQALALFPGISRSGITIAGGLFLGLRRDDAARFAFLMGIPIIAGAGLWKARHLVEAPPATNELAALAVGMLASAISGAIAIRVLLRYLRTRSTMVFVAYRLIAAAVFTLFLLAR